MNNSMPSGVRVIRNTAINALSGVVNASLALVLTPFFLDQLGKELYGVWLLALVFTLTQGFGLADLGLRQTGVRFIAEARGRGDLAPVNGAVSSLLVIFAVLGLIFGGLLVALSGWLPGAFNVGETSRQTATLTFMLVALQLPIDMVASAFQAVLEGFERYGLVRIALVGSRLVWAVGSIILVLSGFGVVAVGVMSVAAAVISLVYSVVAAKRCYSPLAPSPKSVSGSMMRNLVSFGASFTVLRIASVLYHQMDKVILGAVLTADLVAEYDVPYKVHAIAALVLALPASALMPSAAVLGTQKDKARIRDMYLRATRIAVGLGTPITIAAIVHAEHIIVAWVGEEFAHLATPTRVFMMYPLMVAFHNVASSMLLGLGRMRELVTLSVTMTVVNLVVSLALVDRIGLVGVIWGTQIGYLVIWVPYLVVSFRQFDVQLSQWWNQVLRPNLVGPLAQVAAGFGSIALLGDSPSRLFVLVALGVNISLGGALFISLGLPNQDKQKLRSALTQIG